jgi:cystathionine beta-lyase/cystathionine gamma-synthase
MTLDAFETTGSSPTTDSTDAFETTGSSPTTGCGDAFETTGSSPTSDSEDAFRTIGPSPTPSAASAGSSRDTPSLTAPADPFTRIIHGGLGPDPATGAILTPIYQSTTFVQDAVGDHKGFTYTRSGNPTVAALERNLGAIEGTPPALCFATGMAAISTLFLGTLSAGDHIVVSDVVYGGTVRLLRQVLHDFGVGVSFVDGSDAEAVEAAINSRTRLVFVETPANPTLKLTDIEAVAAITRAAGVRLVVDNTFLTAVLQDVIGLGADVAVYSTTKYIEGHNGTVGGALLSRDEELLERLRLVQSTLGVAQSPLEAWLTLRGLKTLPLRLARHGDNALAVARWLEQDPRVTAVTYPGLESFPQRALASRQQRSGGGMLTFEVEGGTPAALELMRSLKLCALAENLGAVETLATHCPSMTHASLTAQEREDLGIRDGLVRLSVGLEGPEDIVADLDQAIARGIAAAREASGRDEELFAEVEAVACANHRGGAR